MQAIKLRFNPRARTGRDSIANKLLLHKKLHGSLREPRYKDRKERIDGKLRSRNCLHENDLSMLCQRTCFLCASGSRYRD